MKQIGSGKGDKKVVKYYVCLSTETKPTADVGFGSKLLEVNASTLKVDKVYRYVPDSDGLGTPGWVQAYEGTTDANLQINHAAVSNANPVPVSDAGGSLTVDVGTALPAGAAIVGKMGIDQTTDGTTNKVQARNATHDDFQGNANLQVGNADVGATNPVPIKTLDDVYEITLSLDTNAYAANDVLADTQLLDASAFPAVGGKLTVNKIVVIDLDNNGGALDIVLLRSNTSLGTENAAITMSDANAPEILMVFPIYTTDYQSFTQFKWAALSVNRIIKAASDATSLYIAAISRDTKTYTASGVKVRVGVVNRSA